MFEFIQRHSENTLGVLSGFDRLRLSGTIRMLVHAEGVCWFPRSANVMFKDFGRFVESVSDRVKDSAKKLAEQSECEVTYLPRGGN